MSGITDEILLGFLHTSNTSMEESLRAAQYIAAALEGMPGVTMSRQRHAAGTMLGFGPPITYVVWVRVVGPTIYSDVLEIAIQTLKDDERVECYLLWAGQGVDGLRFGSACAPIELLSLDPKVCAALKGLVIAGSEKPVETIADVHSLAQRERDKVRSALQYHRGALAGLADLLDTLGYRYTYNRHRLTV